MTDNDFIIRIPIPMSNVRMCDYCDVLLVNEDGITLMPCHLTRYGLMCQKCRGSIKPIKSYESNVNIKQEKWFRR